MSKLSKLKQQAYLAGKKRNWDEAIASYERILELDRSNPAILNELGDLCLRQGQTGRALAHFLSAAGGYHNSGLQNNAVAVYKKVLRHDGRNLTAHWCLAEVRAGQGLFAEGEQHALRFLAAAEAVGKEGRESFLKRCQQLLALYPASAAVLARLDAVFRAWSLPLERARVACLEACREFDAGRTEEARRRVDAVVAEHPEIVHWAEHAAWRRRVSPETEPAAGYAELNEVDLGGAAASGAVPAAPAAADPPLASAGSAPTPAPDARASALATMEGPEAEAEEPDGTAPAAEVEAEVERDPFDIYEPAAPAPESAAPEAGAGARAGEAGPGEGIDLLAEILAEGGDDLQESAARQLQTITSEIGQQAGADPESRYEMGLVYLEMGLFDHAGECFEAAAADPRFSLRSFEMWGISLLRQHRLEEAVAVFGRGIAADAPEAHKLALLYHAGRAHEDAGQPADARELYRRAHAIDAGFLDLAGRLERLG